MYDSSPLVSLTWKFAVMLAATAFRAEKTQRSSSSFTSKNFISTNSPIIDSMSSTGCAHPRGYQLLGCTEPIAFYSIARLGMVAADIIRAACRLHEKPHWVTEGFPAQTTTEERTKTTLMWATWQ